MRNGVFYSDYLAFNPAYAKYGPGLYLVVNAIEAMSEAERIDFGGGDAGYKERLATTNFAEATIYIFAPRARAIIVNALRVVCGKINGVAKRLSTERLKQIWRKLAFSRS